MPWEFTTVTATVNTTHTTNNDATAARAVTFTGNLTTATPALLVGALMTAGNAVFFVSSVSNIANSVVTLVPQTNVAVPTLTAGTSITFQNPINQTGTDNTIGTALAGLATSVPRTDVINAFIDNAGGYAANVTTSMVIDNGSGAAPVIAPTTYTSFINNTLVHYVVAYDAGTRTITFSPALNASLADNARLTLFTQGVLANVGNAGTGPDIYTVHGTRVRVSGTLAWNSWAEQLVLAATCPATVSGFSPVEIFSVAQVMLAGTLTLTGTRPASPNGWGTGSGSICPSPALITNQAGSSSGAPYHILAISGSTVTFTNAIVHSVGSIELSAATTTFANATFSSPFGSETGGPVLSTSGASTFSGLKIVGFRWNIPGNTTSYTLTAVSLDGAGSITQGAITSSITVALLDLFYANNTITPYQLRTTYRTTLGKVKVLNPPQGTANIVGIFEDNNAGQGGNIYFTKNISHALRDVQGNTLAGVKVASRDTLNNFQFNWFTSGQDNPTPNTHSVNGVFLKSDLNSIWDGASVKSYLWTTDSSGVGTVKEYLLGTVINPNRRSINLSAFVDNAAGYIAGATSIVVDNGSGLFSSAPQINGSFFHNNTRHLITAVTTNAADYTLTFSPELTVPLVNNTPLLITNVYRDIRSKATIAAHISNTGGYSSGATTLLVDNGAGARTTLSPQVDTNFIWNGTLHNITAVGTGTANKWQLTIQPPLSASITNGQLLTLQNVAGVDAFDFYTASYLHLPQQQELTLTGTGTLTNNWQLLNDTSITQTTKATVDLYGTTGNLKITTAAQFYDRAKSWWYDNFENLPTSRQGAVLVTRSGTLLNAGALNITLNDNVTDDSIIINGFGFNTSTNTITVRTATFTDTLTTTGTITLSQTGTYSAGIVPATGTVAIAAAGTYDLSGWTFASGATINNTSGGAVTVLVRYAQIANITATGGNISVKSSPVTFSGFPIANNANGVAPAPKFGLFSASAGWTFYQVNMLSGSVSVSLSDIGPEASFTAVTDAIGWIRPPAQTIQANRVDNFSWADLYQEFTDEDGAPIISAIPSPLPISYDQANTRFELKSGETLTFAEVAATKEALTSSETGIENFTTSTLRQIRFISNSAYRRIILPNAFTVAMQADATAGAILIDFLLLREGATLGTYADPFAHGLASTASGLTDRPEVVTAFQNATFVGLTASEIRSALGLASANLDTQLGDIPTTTEIWTHATRGLTDAVTVGTINNNVITANSINSGAITNAKFAAGAIDAAAIATDAITAAKIADNAIDGGALATNAIEKIQANLATQASVNTKASQASVDALPNAGTIADAVWDETLGTRANGTTGKKLADTSTLTVGDIPAGLTAQQVWEYATRALTGTQATNLANISNIPTNPLLTNDARLNNLDATISSRSTLTAAQIRTELATELARLDVAVSTRLATAGYTTPPTTSQIAAAVEAALLNDADGQKLLEAIKDTVQALFDAQADVPVSTLVSLIAAQITADHGSGSYTTANVSALALEATAQAIKTKTDNLPSDPADQSELVTLINTRLAAADYVAPNNTGILTAISALPSASTIADAVWNEALSGHLTAGSTGSKLNLASTLTVGDIPAGLTAQQVWEYATRTLTIASGLTNDQNIRLNEVWRQLGLDINNPVTRIRNLSTGVITEQLGPGGIQIVHSEQNDGNTIITTRQP